MWYINLHVAQVGYSTLKLCLRFPVVLIHVGINYCLPDAGLMYKESSGRMMTSSAGTWRPLLTDAVASTSDELPFPVHGADPPIPPTSRLAQQVATEPQPAPLDLCKPRRSISQQQPGWSPDMWTTHEATASNGSTSVSFCRT